MNCLLSHLLAASLLVASTLSAQENGASKVAGHSEQNQTFASESTPRSSSLAVEESNLRYKLMQRPQDAEVMYRLALVLREELNYKESLATYTQAASLRKPTASELRSVALDYVQLGDFPDAIHWLKIAAAMDPKNIEILYSLGRCLYTENNFDQAETAFRRILALEPKHLKAVENLGLTLDGENHPQEAEQLMRTAVRWADEQSLHDPWPYIDLGTLLIDQARTAEALPFLRKGAELSPGTAAAHEKLGRALLSNKQAAEAATELAKAVELDPKNPKTRFELGRAYHDSGQAEKAAAEFAASKALYGTQHHE